MEDSGFLDPSALARLAAAVNGGASADLGYAGEDSLVADGGRGVAFFKPGWSPELLASTDYVGPLVGVSPHATRSALDAEPDPPATIYDLLLRLVDTWTEADGRSAGRPWNATWGTTCAAGRRIKRHGLVLLEAHCVAPEVARCHLGALHSVAFDTYHGLSHQYPIEHAAFLRCCQEAGLQPTIHRERRYPTSRPFVAVSVNRRRSSTGGKSPLVGSRQPSRATSGVIACLRTVGCPGVRRLRGEGEQFGQRSTPRWPARAARRVEHARLFRRRGMRWAREIDRSLPLLLLGVVMSVAAALLFHVTRGQSLFADEWVFFTYRSHGSAETLFAPHNGSLDLVSLLVYRAVFVLFGPDITVLRLILIALEVLCAGLFFELTRRRVGDWIAFGGTTLLLFLGSSWLLATTVGISLYLAVALGLAALIATERGDLRGDVVACVILVLAVASYSAALPFVAGAVIAIAVRPAPLRWRRAWVVAIPLLLYSAWRVWAAHYTQSPELPFVGETVIAPGAITKAPGLIWQAFEAGLASATGLFWIGARQPFVVDHSWGAPLAVLFVAAALARFLCPGRQTLDRSVWLFLAMPLVYWTALSLVSLQVPGTEVPHARSPKLAGYQYTSVTLLLLAAAALASGVRIPRLALFALAGALLASLVPNLLTLRQASRAFRLNGDIDRAELAAVELVGIRAGRTPIETPQTTPDFTYDLPIPAQDYLAASKRVGSAAAATSSLTTTSPEARRAADRTLIRLYRLASRPSGRTVPPIAGAKAPSLESQAAGFTQSKRGCVSARPRTARTPLSFTLPRGGLSVQADEGPPVALKLRRLSDPPGLPTGNVAGGTRATLRIPPDASRQPWRLLISPAQAVRVCALPERRATPSR